MLIENLIINNLRNHIHTEIDFDGGLNVLHGLNGSGKTTVLEAISICSFTKSFLPILDSSLINKDNNFWQVSLSARNDMNVPYKIVIKYSGNSKKNISSTFGDNLLPKDIIGELPVVVLSPDFKKITFGSPQDRREFLDKLLSQAGRLYVDEILKYKKALKQRNNLLLKAKLEKKVNYNLIEPWTEILIRSGAEIVLRRKKFIDEFLGVFQAIYHSVSKGKEEVAIEYVPYGIRNSFENLDKKGLEEILRYLFEKGKHDEIKRGTTLFGPQKDDIKILINNGVAKEYASQGQHKSLLVSIKFAEYDYLKTRKNETPLILLDDIFSELDKERAKKVIELVKSTSAQTLITVTDKSILKSIISDHIKCKYYQVNNGDIKEKE